MFVPFVHVQASTNSASTIAPTSSAAPHTADSSTTPPANMDLSANVRPSPSMSAPDARALQASHGAESRAGMKGVSSAHYSHDSNQNEPSTNVVDQLAMANEPTPLSHSSENPRSRGASLISCTPGVSVRISRAGPLDSQTIGSHHQKPVPNPQTARHNPRDPRVRGVPSMFHRGRLSVAHLGPRASNPVGRRAALLRSAVPSRNTLRHSMSCVPHTSHNADMSTPFVRHSMSQQTYTLRSGATLTPVSRRSTISAQQLHDSLAAISLETGGATHAHLDRSASSAKKVTPDSRQSNAASSTGPQRARAGAGEGASIAELKYIGRAISPADVDMTDAERSGRVTRTEHGAGAGASRAVGAAPSERRPKFRLVGTVQPEVGSVFCFCCHCLAASRERSKPVERYESVWEYFCVWQRRLRHRRSRHAQ